jgi:hypothetical protein
LRSYGCLGRDRQRNRGFSSGTIRGVSNSREGSKILSFPFRSRLVCSSEIRSPAYIHPLCEVSSLLAEHPRENYELSRKGRLNPQDSSRIHRPLVNKAGMRGRRKATREVIVYKQDTSSKEYCVGLRANIWCVRSKVCASVCALARRANPS